MTEQQVKWASQHDWYEGACSEEYNTYYITVYDSVLDDNVTFDNFQELKEWAGY